MTREKAKAIVSALSDTEIMKLVAFLDELDAADAGCLRERGVRPECEHGDGN